MYEGATRLRPSRRTYVFRKMVLRLHHDEQVQDALYRYYEEASCVCESFSTKQKRSKVLLADYQIDRLVYWEQFKECERGNCPEKQLKGWRRIKKIQSIGSINPTVE